MARTHTESRCRIGIDWYDNEAEANEAAARMFATYPAESLNGASIGYVQVGRDPGFDRKDEHGAVVEFAVVTP